MPIILQFNTFSFNNLTLYSLLNNNRFICINKYFYNEMFELITERNGYILFKI